MMMPYEPPRSPASRAARSLWIAIPLWLALMAATILAGDPTRSTVRVALLFFVTALIGRIRCANMSFVRTCWTVAWLAFAIHVFVAFQDYHHWSHAAAVQHTRERSGFGWGILASHVFTLCWTLDVLWWWINTRTHQQRPEWMGWVLNGFMLFITFNATVVYEAGFIRWAGLAGFFALGVVWLTRPHPADRARK